MPILKKMLTQDGYDVYEEILEICSYMTYFAPSVSNEMWQLWPVMVTSLQTWGVQYFENVLVPMDNYVSRGTEVFLTHPTAKTDVLQLAGLVLMDSANIPDPEALPGPKLLECVLANCKGRVDDMVPAMLAMSLDRLGKTSLSYLQDLLVQVVANCLFYDAVLTLEVLNKNGKTASVLQTWFGMLAQRTQSGKRKHHKREHDKKVCCLGLLALLSAPSQSLPAVVQQGYGQITQTLVSLLIDLKQQTVERKEMETNDEGATGGWPSGWSDDDDDFDEGTCCALPNPAPAFSHTRLTLSLSQNSARTGTRATTRVWMKRNSRNWRKRRRRLTRLGAEVSVTTTTTTTATTTGCSRTTKTSPLRWTTWTRLFCSRR